MEATPHAPAPNVNPDSAASILENLAARAAQLYSLPAVAVKVLELTGSGEVDRGELKACLENDPALTTRILKVVNSSLFGLTRRVTDLGQALALLGVKPLKMLVLGFSLPDQLVAETEKEVLSEYWRHTLLKAAGCRELCRLVAPACGEEAFTAGLLQDVGELVLIQQLGTSYIRFRRQVRKELRPLREAEFLALGFDHVELSARLLSKWGLPASFTELVAARPGGGEAAPGAGSLVPLLRIAEFMATVVENGGKEQAGLAAAAHEELGLATEHVQEILAMLTQRAEELACILSLELPARVDISTEAHARLAEASAQLLEGASEESLLADIASLQCQLQSVARRQVQQEMETPRMHAAERPRPSTRPASNVQDPSSLINDPQLLGNVAAAIARCRGQKRSLSLALFQVHGMVARGGVRESYFATKELLEALEHWSQDRGSGLELPQNHLALLWEDCNRSDGFELARHLLRLSQENAHLDGGLLGSGWVLSAGLATLTLPTRNFPPQELIASAQRCLAAALLCGGGTVKSIEF